MAEINLTEQLIGRLETLKDKLSKDGWKSFYLANIRDAIDQIKRLNQGRVTRIIEIEQLRNELDKFRLLDKCGTDITDGCVVHWTDGGDDLPLEERIATRWDRIAVTRRGLSTTFTVIDSPSEKTRRWAHQFNLGSFIWANTEKYLTVVAANEDEYRAKFSNAGECMAHVLELSLSASENSNE